MKCCCVLLMCRITTTWWLIFYLRLATFRHQYLLYFPCSEPVPVEQPLQVVLVAGAADQPSSEQRLQD